MTRASFISAIIAPFIGRLFGKQQKSHTYLVHRDGNNISYFKDGELVKVAKIKPFKNWVLVKLDAVAKFIANHS